MDNLLDFQKLIGIKFTNPKLLEQAFIHRSYINEHKKLGLEHNERLEFLGDAVLELAVTEYLFLNFNNPEGDLTNWRSALVKTEALTAVAEKLGIKEHFKLSKGELKSLGRSKILISANCIEAIIGAIYLDKGYKIAKQFIIKYIVTRLDEILASGSWMDAKSKFQVITQEHQSETPIYKLIDEFGPDHNKVFIMGVYLKNKLWGRGKGANKQEAQQRAAEEGLDRFLKKMKSQVVIKNRKIKR